VNSHPDLDKKFSPTSFIWGKISTVTPNINPDVIIPELGESWSEPQFGLVKTSDTENMGTSVFFIGGGYSSDNSSGKAVIAVDVFTGAVVRKFTLISADTLDLTQTTDAPMQYSIPSAVKLIDENDNGFIDKVYVGDLGGQIWRIGQVTVDKDGNSLSFPDCDENINSWTAQALFRAPTYMIDAKTYSRKFFSPPSVTFEHGYDLVFIGSGDRESACSTTTGADRIYCIKDIHGTNILTEPNLVDVTNPAAAKPNLSYTNRDVDSNGEYDQGWYIRLVNQAGTAVGEKVLAKSTVFYKTLYISTFTPNNNPCLPGGFGNLYALDYLTGAAVLFEGGDLDGDGMPDLTRSIMIGGGIPSKPVMVLTESSQKLLISVGSTNPEINSKSLDAGVVTIDPLTLARNFYYLYWRQLFN
jgi:type IV pilus assembly protein PilY1